MGKVKLCSLSYYRLEASLKLAEHKARLQETSPAKHIHLLPCGHLEDSNHCALIRRRGQK